MVAVAILLLSLRHEQKIELIQTTGRDEYYRRDEDRARSDDRGYRDEGAYRDEGSRRERPERSDERGSYGRPPRDEGYGHRDDRESRGFGHRNRDRDDQYREDSYSSRRGGGDSRRGDYGSDSFSKRDFGSGYNRRSDDNYEGLSFFSLTLFSLFFPPRSSGTSSLKSIPKGPRRNFREKREDSEQRREHPREREPKELPTSPPFSLFVGNLNFNTTEDDVRDFFSESNVSLCFTNNFNYSFLRHDFRLQK